VGLVHKAQGPIDSMELPTMRAYRSPTSTGLPKASIYKLAEHVAKQLGFQPGASLLPIVKKLGGKIVYVDWELESSKTGSIVVDEEGKFRIHLPWHTSPQRDRFTIAHELGHYVVHFLWKRHRGEEIPNLEAARDGTGREEWEANWFAAAFLMPDGHFRKAFDAHRDIAKVAEEFDVSHAAAEVRARGLGLAL
jgi:Zn-dependent peptidase ImmA (M78 family)